MKIDFFLIFELIYLLHLWFCDHKISHTLVVLNYCEIYFNIVMFSSIINPYRIEIKCQFSLSMSSGYSSQVFSLFSVTNVLTMYSRKIMKLCARFP